MKNDDFILHMDNLLATIYVLRQAGQAEYAHGVEDNVFNNFIRVSGQVGISKEQALMVYLMKHIDGIHAYIKGHKSQRESVHGRIRDAIVYLILLDGMVAENDGLLKVTEILDHRAEITHVHNVELPNHDKH